jgi:hypothetical protein
MEEGESDWKLDRIGSSVERGEAAAAAAGARWVESS